MRNNEAETLSQFANETLEVPRKAEACTAVNSIMRRGFVTVRDMSIFYSELVEALQNVREQGKRITLTVMPRD